MLTPERFSFITIAMLFLAVTSIANAQMRKETMTPEWITNSQAQWVWPSIPADEPNQYVQIRHEISLPENTTYPLEIAISVDSQYAIWLNGEFVEFGQWANFPDDKTYDLIDLGKAARPGVNQLCIGVYHQGESSSRYKAGPGGAMYVVRSNDDIIAVSGPNSQLRRAPDYVNGRVPKITGQLGFTFEHNAAKDDGWRSFDYKTDSTWHNPTTEEMKPLAERPVRPRSIKKLRLDPPTAMKVVAQGVFKRHDRNGSPAAAMQTDSLAFRELHQLFKNPRNRLTPTDSDGLQFKAAAWENFDGAYIILDIGHEEAGIYEMDLVAPEGTMIDIGYGEHLDDLRVRTHVGGRNFAVRYHARDGHQDFLHPYLRMAGRYIQLQITPPAGTADPEITLNYAGLRPTPYPVEHAGHFDSPDSLHNRIWQVSRRTLELCMHEHYEDCPWREQALYSMDGRNQALAGYYCFGNYDFAAASIKLLGQGMDENIGMLELCAPAEVPVTIPSFSLAWILMIDDYLLFTGDREFVKEQFPIARQLIKTFSDNTTGSILNTPEGPKMWNFYEWMPGLDGHSMVNRETKSLEAPLNLFYLLALDAMVNMGREIGEDVDQYATLATKLRAEFAATFWDADEKAFITRVGKDQPRHFAELTQALAILADVVPEGELDALRERLAADNNGLWACTLSHTLYKFDAMLTDREKYAPRVFELIRRDWGYMLEQGATSFWETIDGADAFANAGSLCHGWSGVPAWFYGTTILGVRPTKPGFADYEVAPVTNVMTHATGIVPTPTGTLEIQWSLNHDDLETTVTPKHVSRY